MKLLKFTPKQEQIFNFIADDNRYLICDGAVRSGKTVPMALAFILLFMLFLERNLRTDFLSFCQF